MARHRAPSVCPQAGCIQDQPCPEHTPKAKPWATSTRRSRLPGNWESLRRAVLKRDRGTCRWPGCTAKATDVDHVVAGDDHSLANLQALCHPHHEAKTIAERRQGWGGGGPGGGA